MNRIFLLASLLLITANLLAQTTQNDLQVNWGKPIENNKKYDKQMVVGYDANGYYAVKHGLRTAFNKARVKRVELQHYNPALKLVRRREVQLGPQDVNWDFNSVVQMNDQLYLFATQADIKNRVNRLFLQNIDKSNLTLGTKKPLAAVDLRKALVSSKGKAAIDLQVMGSFDITLSADSSKMLVSYVLPSSSKDLMNYGFVVLDQELQEVWKNEFQLPYNRNLFEVSEIRLRNNGDVFVLGTLFNKVRKFETAAGVNYSYHILSYQNNGTETVEIPVKLKNKFLLDMRLQFDVDGNVICGGFYSDLGRYSTAGTYVTRINAGTNKKEFAYAKHFDIDFLTENLPRGQEAKARKKLLKGKSVESRELSADVIIPTEDGGFVLIGEQNEYTSSTSFSQNMPPSTSIGYLYHDINLIYFSKEGKIIWKRSIPKLQKTGNDGGIFSSYAMSVVDDKMHFIFNDHALNLKEWPKGVIHDFDKSWDSALVLVTVDIQGNKSKISVADSDALRVHSNTKAARIVSGGNLAFFGYSPKYRRLGELKLVVP